MTQDQREKADAIAIYATDQRTGERELVSDDLYWFEENGVRDFGGEGHYAAYTFEVYVNGTLVYPEATDAGR